MTRTPPLTIIAAYTALLAGAFLPVASAEEVTWVSSTAAKPWQRLPLSLTQSEAVPQVRVAVQKTYQTIDGCGGCFNELGWAALAKTSDAERRQVMGALFGSDGCNFRLARLPIGASDFALDAYSLDDTPGDLALKSFSIERDKRALIPFVQAAMQLQPSLRCWGSPWSPPAWMKTNNSYRGGSLKWEPDILRSYATYFSRWVEEYRKAGIAIYAITPQNEPNIVSAYPSCLWSGPQLREFIGSYLGPTLRGSKPNVELWLGLNGDNPSDGLNINNRFATVMEDPKANSFLHGVAFQYDSTNQISIASQWYPDKKYMQSETECGSGENSWADAQHLYDLMRRYFEGGANAYFAWNMVLDDTGKSSWDWRQNALITVNRADGKVTYNGEYYVMRHFSQYVKPGAKRVLTTGLWKDKIAFINPDGSVVLVVGNSAKQPLSVSFQIAARSKSKRFQATLAPESVNTFVVPALK